MASGSPSATLRRSGKGMSLRANYEYHEVNYQYATYPTDVPAGYVVPPTVTNAVVTGPYFNQPTTRSNQVVFAQRMRWTIGREHVRTLSVHDNRESSLRNDAAQRSDQHQPSDLRTDLRDRRFLGSAVKPSAQRPGGDPVDVAEIDLRQWRGEQLPGPLHGLVRPHAEVVDLGRVQLLLELGQSGRHAGISRSGRTAAGRDAAHGLQRSNSSGQRRWALCLVREVDPDGGSILHRRSERLQCSRVPDRRELVEHARVLQRARPIRQVSRRLRLQAEPEDFRAISASTSSTIRTSRKGSVPEPRSSSWAVCPHHSEVESDGPIRNPIQAKCRSPFHVFPKAVYPRPPPEASRICPAKSRSCRLAKTVIHPQFRSGRM